MCIYILYVHNICVYIYTLLDFFLSAVSEQGNVYIYIFAGQCSDSEGQFAWPAWWI